VGEKKKKKTRVASGIPSALVTWIVTIAIIIERPRRYHPGVAERRNGLIERRAFRIGDGKYRAIGAPR